MSLKFTQPPTHLKYSLPDWQHCLVQVCLTSFCKLTPNIAYERTDLIKRSSQTKEIVGYVLGLIHQTFGTEPGWTLLTPQSFSDLTLSAGYSGVLNSSASCNFIFPSWVIYCCFLASVPIMQDWELRDLDTVPSIPIDFCWYLPLYGALSQV